MTDGIRSSSRTRLVAWGVWVAFAIVMGTISVIATQRSVTPNYRLATENWFAGEPLYSMHGAGFVYLPQMAIVYAPWGLLPVALGEFLWRCSIAGVFAAGVARLTRLVSSDDRWFLINSIVSAAISVGCLRNGQATLMIAGMMMLACGDLTEQRWTRATILLALAFAFKPTCLIFILLVGALFPPMLWRLAAGLATVFVAPFLTQFPGYVISQYQAFLENSNVAYAVGETGYWAQLFGIFKVAGYDVPTDVQTVARAVAGLATLAACWVSVRKLSPVRGVYYLFAISTCYLMLFNSRTEGCTYAMIAPVYGILLASAWLQQPNRATVSWLIAGIVCTVINYDLVHLFTRQRDVEVWVCPFICLLVTIHLLVQFVRELKATDMVPVVAMQPAIDSAV